MKKIQDILRKANLTALQTGGIFGSYVEKLVAYKEDTAKKYVGSYGNHYNALTDGPTCAAASTFVSFTLLFIAIFAFLQLA